MLKTDPALLLPLVIPDGTTVPLSLTLAGPVPGCLLSAWVTLFRDYWRGIGVGLRGERRN